MVVKREHVAISAGTELGPTTPAHFLHSLRARKCSRAPIMRGATQHSTRVRQYSLNGPHEPARTKCRVAESYGLHICANRLSTHYKVLLTGVNQSREVRLRAARHRRNRVHDPRRSSCVLLVDLQSRRSAQCCKGRKNKGGATMSTATL